MSRYSEESIQHALSLVKEIESQTDRGAAIIGAAWIEEELSAAIESFVEKDKSAWNRLFGKSGPLSSFAAKIDLARLLGMVSNVVASDLHIIRTVRNEFAHSILDKNQSILSFNTPHIKDKCLAIVSVEHEEHREPRTAFIRACAILNSEFYVRKLIGDTISGSTQVQAFVENAA